MEQKYGSVNDDEKLNEYNDSIRYREYKKYIRNVQLNFEKILTEFNDNINKYDNSYKNRIPNKQEEDEINEFLLKNKKKIQDLEYLHKDGIQNLDTMKKYFNKYSTYSIEITRYFSIFDKFKIQLQTMKNSMDKAYFHNNIYLKKKKENINNINNTSISDVNNNNKKKNNNNNNNNDMGHVFSERVALENSLSELDNMLSVGESTTFQLKLQNNNIIKQLKKMDTFNKYIPQIQKILKKIKYYSFKRVIILSITISLCIFIFCIFKFGK
ncbi:conserved Plasmodium protein, unknown function [Plasmodium sp. gorilla clade G2]|uniref:conserved Plasmodium protein, unknown function n=1 Tax=Plasmodium sp. gorilla clade G2 TaxID=880535 RepID=UPI000D211685|nr:conserved Plasmodium protein, unknown function [Plasmodium sp. gorilla clade G2]SOV19872.1 conserved Plasmodium protein, unknown function [Plasmodium sp. gorilla clade G2]